MCEDKYKLHCFGILAQLLAYNANILAKEVQMQAISQSIYFIILFLAFVTVFAFSFACVSVFALMSFVLIGQF